MNVHLFVNRENLNELKFFILPISVLAWIKSINGSDNTWKQEVPNNIKEDLLEIGFKSIPEYFEVSYFNYENEILSEMLKISPNVFREMSKAWVNAEQKDYKIIKTLSFIH